MSGLSFFATAPRGFADLLARELTAQGAQDCSERPAGVQFQGTLETGYRACLWSRTASRVLLQLAQFEAASADAFYAGVRAQDWSAHIDPARTIACEFTGEHPAITHTHYGALRLKDGICDALRAQTGARPDVALVRPAVRVIAHAYSEGQTSRITLSLDLAGEGLHRRGYRLEAGEAPLRENLAAGLLLRARWDALAARGAPFLDPLCGAGTIVIEAALIAAQRAPGLRREYFGFQGWRGHDEALWQRLRTEAAERALPRVEAVIRGSDADAASDQPRDRERGAGRGRRTGAHRMPAGSRSCSRPGAARDWCAPTRPMASASGIRRRRSTCTPSWAKCCARALPVGRRPSCAPGSSRARCSCAASGCTSSTTARSRAGCCASTWRTPGPGTSRRRVPRARPPPPRARARRCSRTGCARI